MDQAVKIMADKRQLSMIGEGDLQGLATTFDRYGHDCLTWARRIVHEGSKAEEIVFEVFLDLWRRPPSDVRKLDQWLQDRTRQLASDWGAPSRAT